MFIGCSRYPECEHTELIDKPDETAIACPQCGQGHLVQRRSRFGKTFHSCDRYPDCQFVINFKPVAGECPECHYPLLIERRRRRGSDASVPVNNVESRSRRNKSVNNNLPSEAVAHAVAVLKMNMSSPILLKLCLASAATQTAKRPSCACWISSSALLRRD